MSALASPTIRDDGTGNAVLIKHAVGAGRLRLHHEAQVLAAAHMEGVVECVGFDEFDERCELRLRYIEAATLAELPPLSAYDAIDVLIQIGATLAELRDRGIRHGALRGDHVLLARPCRPVLCGFGAATGPSDQSQHPPGADLAALAALAASELTRADRTATDADGHRRCADALAAANFLAAAPASASNDGEPLTEWLMRMRHIRDAAAYEQHAAADGFGIGRSPIVSAGHGPHEFAHGPHDLRERLRAQAAASAPAEAEGRGTRDPQPGTGSTPERRRVASYTAIAAALAVAAVIGWRTLAGSDPVADASGVLLRDAATPITANAAVSPGTKRVPLDDAAAADDGSASAGIDAVDGGGDRLLGSAMHSDASGAAPTPTGEGATLLYATHKHTTSPACPDLGDGETSALDDALAHADGPSAETQADARRADVRGDGCPVPVRIEPPTADRPAATVYSPDGHWAVGAHGDLLAVGDWDCDGRATVAAVSADTGIVSFFGSWPRTERPVAPARIAHVPRHPTALSIVASTVVSTAASDEVPAHAASRDELACDALVVSYGELSLTLGPSAAPADMSSWLLRRQ